MTCIRCSADSWTMVAHSSCSADSGVSKSSVVMPSTPFIGVRISWLMRARNSLLARAPDSAASRAWRSSASWRMRAVTSVKKPVAPSSKGKIRSATTRWAPFTSSAMSCVDVVPSASGPAARVAARAAPKAGSAASSGWPITTARGTPVARSAASFQDSTRPSRLITNMPSLIDEMTSRRRVSERCTACSTFERCIVRSITRARNCMTQRTTTTRTSDRVESAAISASLASARCCWCRSTALSATRTRSKDGPPSDRSRSTASFTWPSRIEAMTSLRHER